jgi:hypothetical protein
MRGFISYTLAAIVVLIALDVIAPLSGFGLAINAWPVIEEENAMNQLVDRTHKADRLQLPLANGQRVSPPRAPAVMIGCEPVFSSLSASSRANFAGRCVA